VPYWTDQIIPSIQAGKQVLVSAHGNSLRALVKHLDGIPDDEIPGLNIPTGVPLVYELDQNMKPTSHYDLGDPEAIAQATKAVKNQGSAQ
jgi:2,3-bisphosphoglycerate-dependent phosphoglycerate mutase